MKSKRPTLVLAVVAMFVVGVTAYRYRVYITTWLWHLRHGTAISIGSYTVPIPGNWYVEDEGRGNLSLVRLDTDDRSDHRRIKAHSGILIYVAPRAPAAQDLGRVLSREKELMEKKGILVQERTVSLGSDLLSCLGNTVSLNTHGILDKEPVAWNCSSPGGLQVTFEATEPDLNQDWDIVSHIRKTS